MGVEQHDSGDRVVARSIDIAAAPGQVFDLLADPRRHSEFDGSGTVRSQIAGPDRLTSGSKFGMRMHMGLPYTIRNTVVEYEQDKLIAWSHFGGHRWRYQLEPLDEGRTRVTESFDWSTARIPVALEWVGFPKRNASAIEKTLERLKTTLES